MATVPFLEFQHVCFHIVFDNFKVSHMRKRIIGIKALSIFHLRQGFANGV